MVGSFRFLSSLSFTITEDFILLMKNSYDTDHTSPQRAKICQLQYYKNISNGKQGLRLLNPSYQSPEQVWEQDVPAGMRKLSWCRYGPAGILTHNALVMTNELLKQRRFVSNNTFSGKKASWQSHTQSERCDNAAVLLLETHVYIRELAPCYFTRRPPHSTE